MSRSVILKVLPLAGALVVLLAIPAGSATKVVFPANCGKPTFKPKSIVVACADANNRLTRIKWLTYGSRSASGTATAKVNDCDPNCVSGEVKNYPALVTLTRPKNCGRGVTQFTRLTETFTHSRPSGTSKRLSISFPCSS